MRVIDLLQLLSDYPKNTPVRVRMSDSADAISGFETREVLEQPQLLITATTSGKAMKCWELIMLLDKKDWRQHFVYVVEAKDVRPLFGLQEVAGAIVLN